MNCASSTSQRIGILYIHAACARARMYVYIYARAHDCQSALHSGRKVHAPLAKSSEETYPCSRGVESKSRFARGKGRLFVQERERSKSIKQSPGNLPGRNIPRKSRVNLPEVGRSSLSRCVLSSDLRLIVGAWGMPVALAVSAVWSQRERELLESWG